jgi:hypothetical protein
MAKAKPNKNQAKKKAKVTKPAKVVKKDDKKVGKKPIAQAAIAGLKKAKSVLASVVSKKPEAKKAQAPEKNNAKANAKGEKAAAQAPSKADAKLKSKSKKVEKKSDDEFEDDLLGDDFGDSEIAEYEEDLKEVEDEEEDSSVELSDEEEDDKKDEEIYLTDSEGRRLCKVRVCDQVANVDEYCRFHYLLLWKKIQIRKDILNDGKLEKYVEDLTSRYPDKFLEVIRKDLKTEKDFLSVIQEMELDENALTEAENEDEVQSFADEIRGIGEAPSLDEDGDF